MATHTNIQITDDTIGYGGTSGDGTYEVVVDPVTGVVSRKDKPGVQSGSAQLMYAPGVAVTSSATVGGTQTLFPSIVDQNGFQSGAGLTMPAGKITGFSLFASQGGSDCWAAGSKLVFATDFGTIQEFTLPASDGTDLTVSQSGLTMAVAAGRRLGVALNLQSPVSSCAWTLSFIFASS